MRLANIYSPYYKEVTDLLRQGVANEIDIYNSKKNQHEHTLNTIITSTDFSVTGALELPLALKYVCESQKFDGAVVMGCVIRGETSHYDVVVNESIRKIMDISIDYNFPVGNAILTVESIEQAIIRACINKKNKGADAFAACLSLHIMQNNLRQLA